MIQSLKKYSLYESHYINAGPPVRRSQLAISSKAKNLKVHANTYYGVLLTDWEETPLGWIADSTDNYWIKYEIEIEEGILIREM